MFRMIKEGILRELTCCSKRTPGSRKNLEIGGVIRLVFKVCPVAITALWKPKSNCLVVLISQVSASHGLIHTTGFRALNTGMDYVDLFVKYHLPIQTFYPSRSFRQKKLTGLSLKLQPFQLNALNFSSAVQKRWGACMLHLFVCLFLQFNLVDEFPFFLTRFV